MLGIEKRISPITDNREKEFSTEAREYNERRRYPDISLAKAICKLEEDRTIEWHLRIIKEIKGKAGNSTSSIGSSSSSSSNSQILGERDQLIEAIRELIQTIETNEEVMIDPKEIERKLRKVILYLTKSDIWPFDKPIGAVIEMFTQYSRRFVRTKRISAENQHQFNQALSQLNKGLRNRLMTLEDIYVKIFTKSQRASSKGLHTFTRIKELLRDGTEKIYHLELGDETTIEYVKSFNLALAFHAFVYKPNVDNEQAQTELKEQVDRLIDVLADFDLRFEIALDSGTLLSFFRTLLRRISRHITNKIRLEHQLPPLLWTLDRLVNNSHFIEYMQPSGKHVNNIIRMVTDLFTKNETWKAIIDFIVPLGDSILFKGVLTQTPKLIETLTQHQINYIFHKLNVVVSWENHLKGNQYQEMYRDFIELLASNNRLHYLQHYSKQLSHIGIVRSNLIRQMGFNFMEHIDATASFFGNPTYLAIAVNDQTLSQRMNSKQTLVKLFSGYASSPVINKESFFKELSALMVDFGDLSYESLAEVVLSRLGESTMNPSLSHPAEVWLEKEVKNFYTSIKRCIFHCLPLNWEPLPFYDRFEGSPIGRICLYNQQLYLIEANGNDIELVELFTPLGKNCSRLTLVQARDHLYTFITGVSTVSDTLLQQSEPNPVETSDNHASSSSTSISEPAHHSELTTVSVLASLPLDEVKVQLQELMAIEENRRAVADLTAAFMSFNNHREIKNEIEKLLQVIFRKLKESKDVSFRDRLSIIKDFLQAISPFFKQLERLIEQRFFKNGNLKTDIGHHLTQALAAGVIPPEIDHVVQQLTSLVSKLCVDDIRDILEHNRLEILRDINPQLEYVIGRKIDELSYSTQEFLEAFWSYYSHQLPVSNISVPISNIRDIVTEAEIDAIKHRVIRDYGDFLKDRPIPVKFVLPNQAIAIRLCLSRRLENNNLLIKLGTGQGKSLVIAMAAVNEAQKIRANPNGKVFVFTNYDYLAKQGHEFGEYFFRKEGLKSLCISRIEDLDRYGSDVNIIYADIENISGIIQEIMLRLLENRASLQEREFINLIYGNVSEGPAEDIRVILDEYDLLLHDLHDKKPYVSWIPPQLIDTAFVGLNSDYFPVLNEQIQNAEPAVNGAGIDHNNGREFYTIPHYSITTGFNLYPTVMRLSEMIKRSKRVIGLSGTATQTETHGLRDIVLFFEIPSSQNPNVFETKIQSHPREAISDKSYISCQQKLNFPILRKEEGIIVVNQADVTSYCQAIVEDIVRVREEARDTTTYRRPILIFGDHLLKYKTPENPIEYNLWNTLETAIRSANIPLNTLIQDVQDTDLQEIARSGQVTLTTIKYGRGADIRVSLDVDRGLHVIVGVPLKHERLLRQMVGRTGRRGSYSAITIDKLIKDTQTSGEGEAKFNNALHELTRMFLQSLTRPYDASGCKKWLMFLSQSKNSVEINRDHAQEIIGHQLPEDFPTRYLA